jgi:hypothetical protein
VTFKIPLPTTTTATATTDARSHLFWLLRLRASVGI